MMNDISNEDLINLIRFLALSYIEMEAVITKSFELDDAKAMEYIIYNVPRIQSLPVQSSLLKISNQPIDKTKLRNVINLLASE